MTEQAQAEETVVEEVVETPEANEDKATGTTFVEADEMSPAVQARFKRVYGNMKQNERIIAEQNKVTRLMADKLERMEAKEAEARAASLQARQKDAFENGDFVESQKLTDQLIDHKLSEKDRIAQGKIEVPEHRVDNNPIPEDQMAKIGAWAAQVDGSGTPLRPWANPTHPQNGRVVKLIDAAIHDPDLYDPETGLDVDKALKYVDSKMRSTKQTAAAVLPGSNDASRPSTKRAVKLTSEQLRVAEGMGYDPAKYAALLKKHGGK